ncbi:hypothetical protein CFP56_008347 [Quercus suber]|uniref:Uncharacterized protein n=1 Tax=Quercus suber TaxID=58331 RepID=A0AAW0L5A6_QUESU
MEVRTSKLDLDAKVKNNMDHRRSVLASLVKRVYILERDRQQHRHESQALAPSWANPSISN